MMKAPFNQKVIIALNIYMSNNSFKPQKMIELKQEIEKSTIIVKRFQYLLSITDRTCRKKISHVDLTFLEHST